MNHLCPFWIGLLVAVIFSDCSDGQISYSGKEHPGTEERVFTENEGSLREDGASTSDQEANTREEPGQREDGGWIADEGGPVEGESEGPDAQTKSEVKVNESNGVVTIENGPVTLIIGLADGRIRGELFGSLLWDGFQANCAGHSTQSGFVDYTSQDISDGFGIGKELTFEMKGGGSFLIRIYGGEEFFAAQLDIADSSSEALFSGNFLSGSPRKISVWYHKPNYWDIKHRPLVEALDGRILQSIFSVAGWDGDDRPGLLVGSVSIEPLRPKTELEANSQGMVFRASSSQDSTGKSAWFAFFGSRQLLISMERYGDLIHEWHQLELPDWIPAGFCTWDAYGDSVTGQDVIAGADALVSLGLKDHGMTLFQIDDGWQRGWRASGDWEANDKFPTGMQEIALQLHSRGLRAGIWIAPFCDEDNPDWKGNMNGLQHPEFCTDPPQSGMQRYDLFDQDFLTWIGPQGIMKTLTETWGFDYIKVDFLYNGNGDDSQFRRAVQTMNSSLRQDAYLLNCNSFPWLAIGAGDGMRVGEDVGVSFDYAQESYSIVPAIRGASYQWYANRRIWINDADQVHVREPLTMGEARIWATLVGLSGGAILTGDKFWELPADRLALLKSIVPPYGVAARPLDMFERYEKFPTLFWLEVNKSYGRTQILAVMNWDVELVNRTIPFGRLFSVSSTQEFLVWEFWNKEFLGKHSNSISLSIPGHDCRILSFIPKGTFPQVLATSRHITQGGVDLVSVNWEPGVRRLQGMSKNLIVSQKYSLVLYLPTGYVVQSANANGIPMQIESISAEIVYASWTPVSDSTTWEINF